MKIFQNPDNWLAQMFWHKSDTPETLMQKTYLVRNSVISCLLVIVFGFVPLIILRKFQLLLLVSPLVLIILLTNSLLIILKRGVKWFLYSYYGAYIIICCLIVLKLGGLPWSAGVWGGAFICFTLGLGIKNKTLLIVNASIYTICLMVIAFSYPHLTPFKELTPELNNLLFTINEIWMCLFLVKSFYDSIVVRTNEARRKAEHLQELDLLKSKLYANITHEFRTPLTLIRGNAEEISEHNAGKTGGRANNIVQSSDKILFLVNQMLNLSKIEEGNVPMHYIQTDLVEFTGIITGSFQGYADLRKIKLHYQPQCSQLIMDIEKEKLEESLSNLISNAIKYTPGGGEVVVSVRKSAQAVTTVKQVEISVRDTGIGIPEEELNKIFIRFYRIGDNRFPYQEGAGIGLTLVNEYVKLMKGSIHVKSSPGKGSEFVITLPVTHNAETEEKFSSGTSLHTTGYFHIAESGTNANKTELPLLLIIEDNPELREYLIRLLASEYQVLTAVDGTIGVEKALEHIPDIILSDVMMPGKDGYQVCRELKNDFRTSHIPIVLLTARADTGSRITGMELGADAYLTKPFVKKELQICLHNLLVQREAMRLKFSNVSEKKIDTPEHGLNGKFMGRVMDHLEVNYQNDWYDIHHLYTALGISRVQLHRKLTALTGQSASNFIRNFRLQKAKTLLLETDKQVSDIAFEVGFSDANYFSKAFIQEFGVASSQLRKSSD